MDVWALNAPVEPMVAAEGAYVNENSHISIIPCETIETQSKQSYKQNSKDTNYNNIRLQYMD